MTDSNPTNPPPPVLEYPRELYAGAYCYRSPRCFFIAAVTGVAAFVFWFVPAPAAMGRLEHWIFGIGALFWGLISLKMIFGIITDSKIHFRLTTIGIEAEGKLVPWSKVRLLAAMGFRKSRRVELIYKEQVASSLIMNRSLMIAPGMLRSDYEQLIVLLKAELSEMYPDLELGG